jgi:hypothetical protein
VRRVGAYILIVLGFFFIFAAPLLRFYALPRIEKVPLDIYSKDVAAGTGSYFSTNLSVLATVGPVPLRNIGVSIGRPDEGSKSVVVIDRSSVTQDMSNNAATIDAGKDRYVFDRVTGVPVHCCGEAPRHEGLTLKFPFNTRKQTYPFWDGTAGRAFPAAYQGERVVDGIKVYDFVQRIGPIDIGTVDVPGKLAGAPDERTVTAPIRYTSTTRVSVEPSTGAILVGDQQAERDLVSPSDGHVILVLAKTDLGSTPADIQQTADRIKSNVLQLTAVRSWLPIGGPVVGIALVIGGLLLLPRRREELQTLHEPAATVAPATG